MSENILKEISFHIRLEGRESSTRAIKETHLVVLGVPIRFVSLRSWLGTGKGFGWHREDAQGHGNHELLVVEHA